jgi:hypothetical protein
MRKAGRVNTMLVRSCPQGECMTKRAVVLIAIVLSAGVTIGCSGDSGSGPSFGDTGAMGGGYDSDSFQSFGFVVPNGFAYMYGSGAGNEDNWDCVTDGHCGLGGKTDQFGNVTNGGANFMFVSTANIDNSDGFFVVTTSGIKTEDLTIPNASQYSSLRLVLEWAFLTSRLAPATHNDSAIVRVRAGNDSATLFKVTSADLQSGARPQKPGGCGQQTLFPGHDITYANCTDWTTTNIDLTAWLDRPSFILQFIVAEGSQSLSDTDDKPSALLFRRAIIQGGK